MDANRRWAKKRNVPTLEGHRKGLDNLKDVIETSLDAGVETMYFYGFSTENWKRSEEEVSYLMDLFREAINTELDEMKKMEVRVVFAGTLERFADDIQQMMRNLEEETKDFTKATVVMCLSYGGRAELVDGVNKLLKENREFVTEDELNDALWTGPFPHADLIIRTGGDHRLSNFLTWQSAYSELHFTDTYWPDFDKDEILAIFRDYAGRERRMGK